MSNTLYNDLERFGILEEFYYVREFTYIHQQKALTLSFFIRDSIDKKHFFFIQLSHDSTNMVVRAWVNPNSISFSSRFSLSKGEHVKMSLMSSEQLYKFLTSKASL